MASPQKLIHAMQIILLVYPKMTVSQDTWAIYMAALSDISDDDLIQAVTECVVHDQDFDFCHTRKPWATLNRVLHPCKWATGAAGR